MSLFSPLHPRFVHFPIALLVTGSVAALAYMLWWRREPLAVLAWSTVFLGWLAVFAAVLTGLIDQNRANIGPEALDLMNMHIAAGIALIIVYGLVLYLRLREPGALDDPRRRPVLVLLLILGLAVVVVEGGIGGILVYDFGIGVTGL
jgi:uncharacterized membrane protein